jgi:uncharacterized protein (TIGR04255 family)
MVSKTKPSVLPNAPLAEVVFELRWDLQAGPTGQPILQSDPGLLPLMEAFALGVKKIGYRASKDMSHPLQTGPYGVAKRFYKADDKPFPIMQIGPGIFATNESSNYEFTAFKKQIISGASLVLKSYPKLSFFPLRPRHLELRYIDVFDKKLLGKAAFFDFLNKGTTLKIELPPMFADRQVFDADPSGRLNFRTKLKRRKDSVLIIDFGSATNPNKEDMLRLETKVVSVDSGVPNAASADGFLRELGKWLEFAHGVTSPLFQELITDAVMAKFRG